VQSLIGTETKDNNPQVVDLIQGLVGGNEFSNPQEPDVYRAEE